MTYIAELHLYPIKSCAGISLTSATVTAAGLIHAGVGDREWMVVDSAGKFLTQREHPRMALIRPTLDDAQLNDAHLNVNASGMETLRIPLKLAEKQQTSPIQLWDEDYPAFDMGDAAAAWLTQFLGLSCRLVRFDRSVERLSNLKWTQGQQVPNLFSDGFPLLLISTASLEDLNQKLQAQGRAALPMNRFRPNIVIDGIAAFEEDYAESLRLDVGNRTIQLNPVKPCPRCPIPAVDQTTGEVGPSPLDILQTYRANPLVDGGITFGMNVMLTQGEGQTLYVGDEVEVTLAF